MTINLETEVVSSRFDQQEQVCYYTIARDDRRWTVALPLSDLNRYKANKLQRRTHIANALENAMRGPADG